MGEVMKEAALVFDVDCKTIYTHLPVGRSSTLLPDSPQLWDVLWNLRDIAAGVAHIHPWDGEAIASSEDVTTFRAIELAVGDAWLWPVITFTDAKVYAWSNSKGVYIPLRTGDAIGNLIDYRLLRRLAKEDRL